LEGVPFAKKRPATELVAKGSVPRLQAVLGGRKLKVWRPTEVTPNWPNLRFQLRVFTLVTTHLVRVSFISSQCRWLARVRPNPLPIWVGAEFFAPKFKSETFQIVSLGSVNLDKNADNNRSHFSVFPTILLSPLTQLLPAHLCPFQGRFVGWHAP
jgi:hypothetical protein